LLPFHANNRNFAAVSRDHRHVFYESPQSVAGKENVYPIYTAGKFCNAMGFRCGPLSGSYNRVFVDSQVEENAVLDPYTSGEVEWERGCPIQDRLDEQTHTALTSLGNRSCSKASRQDQNTVQMMRMRSFLRAVPQWKLAGLRK
jgi:hypothetical protein